MHKQGWRDDGGTPPASSYRMSTAYARETGSGRGLLPVSQMRCRPCSQGASARRRLFASGAVYLRRPRFSVAAATQVSAVAGFLLQPSHETAREFLRGGNITNMPIRKFKQVTAKPQA